METARHRLACLGRFGSRLQGDALVPEDHQQAPLSLFIDFVFQLRLFGAAAKIEIRYEPPLTGEINMIVNRGNEAGFRLPKIRRFACLVGQNHSKEDSRVTAPVVLEGIAPFHNPWYDDVREPIEFFDQS